MSAFALLSSVSLTGASYATPQTATAEKSVPDFAALEKDLKKGKAIKPVLRKLGEPTAAMAGRGDDTIYHYHYLTPDNSKIMLVIVASSRGKIVTHKFYEQDCSVTAC